MASKSLNPLTRIGWWIIFFVFGFLGLTFLTGLKDLLGPYISPVIFLSACFTLIWLYFQIRTGKISIISQSGITYTYSRNKEPILFFLVSTLFGLMALTLVIALGSDIFFGCEGSLINPC